VVYILAVIGFIWLLTFISVVVTVALGHLSCRLSKKPKPGGGQVQELMCQTRPRRNGPALPMIPPAIVTQTPT
jgi:hypothetical protein